MLKTGRIIKELRKKQNVTQEKLAAYLNVSYQAISKWENGTALPDIALIPQIANFFGVTSDELLGMNKQEQTEELKEYEKIYRTNAENGKILKNTELAREVLKKYPRNYQWMLNLAYPLITYVDTTEHETYSKENNFRQEAVKICERILEDCTDDSIRHSAIQILCYTYPQIGQAERAEMLANKMPDFYICKEQLLTHIYRGEKQIEECQKLLLTCLSTICGLIWMLNSENLMGEKLTISQRIEMLKTSNSLLDLILDKDKESPLFAYHKYQNCERLAKLYGMANDLGNAMKSLLLAEECAELFDKDEAQGEKKYKSVLVNRLEIPQQSARNWEGSMKDYMLSAIESNPHFSKLADDSEFAALKERLKA